MAIKVYCNPGENASLPWLVGLHNGRCIVDSFGKFRSPVEAINYAIEQVSPQHPDCDVEWPETVILN